MSNPMLLRQLLQKIPHDGDAGDVAITGLQIDSRRVAPGDAFFAYPGLDADGRDHIDEALERGAVAIVYEARDANVSSMRTLPFIAICGLRDLVSIVAEKFFRNPSRDLFVVGITGTNGKTSCAHLLAQAFGRLGIEAAIVGTMGWGFPGKLTKAKLTTPDPVSLHRRLFELRQLGATHVCMEVSSHALSQGRVSGVSFDAAVFTNLTHDHLDYHASIDEYAAAKALLFEFSTLQFNIINHDDSFGEKLISSVKNSVWTYGVSDGDVHARDIEIDQSGLRLTLDSPAGPMFAQTRLVGRINVHNVLAVTATLLAYGLPLEKVEKAVSHLQPVPGRMELFKKSDSGGPSVVVDYAHTPDALERALKSLRDHCTGRVWCVFGCGGNRDSAKRPLMGAIAERLADEIVVTDDNPRLEIPVDITNQIVAGMTESPKILNDRVQAIQWAITHAGTQDWVLVAGKGHEDTQQVGEQFHRMDDREIVTDCLRMAA